MNCNETNFRLEYFLCFLITSAFQFTLFFKISLLHSQNRFALCLSAITFVVAILSMGLSLLALALFRYPFGIQAVIGVIGSIGVSINAAIIIITALQADARALRGDAERIAELVMAQGRHIVSTTLTTFGGFVPLILAGGGFWPPFAMSIAGGVLLSTVVSFYFVPPAFQLLARRGKLPARDVSTPAAHPDAISAPAS